MKKQVTFSFIFLSFSEGFTPPHHASRREGATAIFGAFNKRNKQAELMKKFDDAKRRREMNEAGLSEEEISKETKVTLSVEEIKERNDKKRFEELLNRETNFIGGDDLSGTNYMTRKQEEENANAYKRSDRAFEGDPANDEVFRDLIYMKTGEALGKLGAERLLPWFSNKNSGKQKDFLVVVTDPRERSSELRSVIPTLAKLPVDLRSRTIVINTDKPSENRKFLKKQKITSLDVYTDQGRAWMNKYTVLGEDRWSMTMMVLSEGRIQKLVRDLDSELTGRVIRNAVDSL